MKKLLLYIVEKGDIVVAIKDIPSVKVRANEALIFVSKIELGVICLNPKTNTQLLVPPESIEGIFNGERVPIHFE